MKAFRCAWTGLLFPGDFMKEWGRKYGIGHGPVPRSEALNSRTDLPVCIPDNGDMEQAMHPMELVPGGQLDLVEVTEEEFAAGKAILHQEDLRFQRRAAILRNKQLAKDTKLAAMIREERIG